MDRKHKHLVCVAAILASTMLGGCPAGITITLPDGTDVTADLNVPVVAANIVRVEVFNDTDWEVAPRIRFDDDSNWFARLAPSEELATGILQPGESIRFDMACDKLGLILSDEAGQFLPGDDEPLGQAEQTRVLTREHDYDCGDTILFHFLGSEDGFGVAVSVNNVVVD
jgi:hypothetical protein